MSSSFFIKVIKQSRERLVAACDEEIMGVELLSHGVKIKASKFFYGVELVSADELLDEVKKSTSVNVIGTRAVNLLIENRIIHEEAILWFDYPDKKTKVGHAMMLR